MKTYTVVRNQMIQDVAIQLYGNVDAVGELIELNPLLTAKRLPTTPNGWQALDMGVLLPEGMVLNYDENSALRNKAAMAKLTKDEQGNIEPICTADPEFLGDDWQLHRYTLQYLRAIDEGGWPDLFSWHDVLALDRLVRDLNGEENGEYDTYEVWANFTAIYPMMGDGGEQHKWNLVSPGAFTLLYNGGVSHMLNGMKTDGDTGYANTQILDGIDLNNENVQAGASWKDAVVPSPVPQVLKFLFGTWDSGNYGLAIYNNTYYPDMSQPDLISGMINGTNHYSVETEVFYKGFAHVQNNGANVIVYVNGIETVSNAYVTGGSTGTSKAIWIGGLNHSAFGFSLPTERNFTFVYFGLPMVLAKHKAFWNAMNRYLWKKGVNDSFTPLV